MMLGNPSRVRSDGDFPDTGPYGRCHGFAMVFESFFVLFDKDVEDADGPIAIIESDHRELTGSSKLTTVAIDQGEISQVFFGDLLDDVPCKLNR